MTILELLEKVKEKNLDKYQLEDYHSQISSLFAKLQLEMADIEKEEAMFMGKDFGEKMSVADRKVQWRVTQRGQRLIELKRYTLACKELLNSLKSRIYSLI
jgi:hypothetical protein